MHTETDVIVVGGGLAGLVAATEVADAGKRVVVIDQESEQNLGGQAFWSLGGLFMVDTPEQRRLRIKDSHDLALSDWMGTAGFDRPEDHWPRKWAEAYVAFASGEMRPWLKQQGMTWFPVVGWAERGGYGGFGHGNSVPRFHITWGSGPGVLVPFLRRAREAENAGRLHFRFRHRVDGLIVNNGTVVGVRGTLLEPSALERGVKSSRTTIGEFELRGQAVVIASGGIGGDIDLVRKHWPARLGSPPQFMVQGVPDYVDGRMLTISQAAGAGDQRRPDVALHRRPAQLEPGLDQPRHPDPPRTVVPLARRHRQTPAPPLFPGFDNLGTLEHIMKTGYDYSWFVLNQRIIQKEFALSGSEQNPDFASKDWKAVIARGRAKRATPAVEAFKEHGADFIVANNLDELVRRMNELSGQDLIDRAALEREISAPRRSACQPVRQGPPDRGNSPGAKLPGR